MRMRYNGDIREYLNDLKEYPKLKMEEIREFVKRSKQNDLHAQDVLINSGLLTVVVVAKNFINRGYSLNVLIKNGNNLLVSLIDDLIVNEKNEIVIQGNGMVIETANDFYTYLAQNIQANFEYNCKK